MRGRFIAIGQSLVKLALATALLVMGAALWVTRDIARVRQFCDATKAGELLTETKARALRLDIAGKQFEKSAREGGTGDFLLLIPATYSMGEFACFIRHDGQRVVSHKIEGP